MFACVREREREREGGREGGRGAGREGEWTHSLCRAVTHSARARAHTHTHTHTHTHRLIPETDIPHTHAHMHIRHTNQRQGAVLETRQVACCKFFFKKKTKLTLRVSSSFVLQSGPAAAIMASWYLFIFVLMICINHTMKHLTHICIKTHK